MASTVQVQPKQAFKTSRQGACSTQVTCRLPVKHLLQLPDLAYAQWQIPLLVKRAETLIEFRALKDLLRKPINVGEAINTRIVDKCATSAVDEEIDWHVRREALNVLHLLAEYPQCRKKILAKTTAAKIEHLLRCNQPEIRVATFQVLLELSNAASNARELSHQVPNVCKDLNQGLPKAPLEEQALTFRLFSHLGFQGCPQNGGPANNYHEELILHPNSMGYGPLTVAWCDWISTLELAKTQSTTIPTLAKIWDDVSYEGRREILRCMLGASTTVEGRKLIYDAGLLASVTESCDARSFDFQGPILQVICNLSQYPPARSFLRQNHLNMIKEACDEAGGDHLAELAKRTLQQLLWKP